MSLNNLPQKTRHYEEKKEYHTGNDSKDVWQPYFNLYKLQHWENLYEIQIFVDTAGLKLLNESLVGQLISDNYQIKSYDEPLSRIKYYIDQMYEYLYFRRNDYCFMVKHDVLLSQTSLSDLIYNDKFQYLRLKCHEPFKLRNMSSIIEFVRTCLTRSGLNYRNVILINVNGNLDEVRSALETPSILNNSTVYSGLWGAAETTKTGKTLTKLSAPTSVLNTAKLSIDRSGEPPIESYSKLLVFAVHPPFQKQKEKFLLNQDLRRPIPSITQTPSSQKFQQQREQVLETQRAKLADWKLVQHFTAQNMQIRTFSEKYIAKKRELVKILKKIHPKQQFTKLANQNSRLLQSQIGAGHETALQSFLTSKTFINLHLIEVELHPSKIENVLREQKISEMDEINQFNAREQIQIAQTFQDFVVRLQFFQLTNANCSFEFIKDGHVLHYNDFINNSKTTQFDTEIPDNKQQIESQKNCQFSLQEADENIEEILEFIQRMNARSTSKKASKLVYQAETFVNQQLMLKTPFNMQKFDDMIVFMRDCNRNKNIGYFYINQNVAKNGVIKIPHDKIAYFDKYYLNNKICITIK